MPVVVIYIAVGMLLLGALPLPYGYYSLLRLVITGVFSWATYVSYSRKQRSLSWVFGFVAILFNPFIIIHLPKELWIFVDVCAGILLLLTKRKIRETNGSMSYSSKPQKSSKHTESIKRLNNDGGQIHFRCSNCQTKYSAKQEQVGKEGTCKNCGEILIVPS